MQAVHQQDIGASSALRAYYTRIALEEQLELTGESLHLIDTELQKQQAAQAGGMPTGADISSFARHRFDIQDNQLQILSQDRQLRSLLAQLADLNYSMSDVCQEQLEVFETPLDCSRLQQQALALRSDLKSWIYLTCQVTEDSAPVFAQMLGTLIGNWGMPLPKAVGLRQLFNPPDYSTLASNMRHELQLIADTHRQWICQAVQEKCAAVELAYGRTELARQVIGSWEARIDQLEQLDSQGEGMPEKLASARSELLKARADEISRRLDARLAEIDLAEACGGMRDRCCQGLPWLLTGYE